MLGSSTVGKASCPCDRESMPSFMAGASRTRRPMPTRSQYGPGPGFSGLNGALPAMYCQSDVRKLTWSSSPVDSKCGVMSKMFVPQIMGSSEFHCAAWPHGLMQSNESPGAVVSVLSVRTFARTRQPCTMPPSEKMLPGKRRKRRTVPAENGVDAKLTHGDDTMSSNQLRMTTWPGPNAMSELKNGRFGSVPSQAHVGSSAQTSLSVMCENVRNHGESRNGSAFAVSTMVTFGFSAPSKFSLYAVPPVTTTLSTTRPASRKVG